MTDTLHCLWNFKYFLNDNNSISELLIVIINVSQLSIDSHKTRIWKMYEQNTWWREIYRRSRVSSSFLVASALLFTISTCRLYTVLSLPLYIFFLFARCTSLRATKGEYTPTQFHLTQDSNLVVYFANLLTSFGFDGVPLFATFVSIPTITCRWTCKGMFD